MLYPSFLESCHRCAVARQPEENPGSYWGLAKRRLQHTKTWETTTLRSWTAAVKRRPDNQDGALWTAVPLATPGRRSTPRSCWAHPAAVPSGWRCLDLPSLQAARKTREQDSVSLWNMKPGQIAAGASLWISSGSFWTTESAVTDVDVALLEGGIDEWKTEKAQQRRQPQWFSREKRNMVDVLVVPTFKIHFDFRLQTQRVSLQTQLQAAAGATTSQL